MGEPARKVGGWDTSWGRSQCMAEGTARGSEQVSLAESQGCDPLWCGPQGVTGCHGCVAGAGLGSSHSQLLPEQELESVPLYFQTVTLGPLNSRLSCIPGLAEMRPPGAQIPPVAPLLLTSRARDPPGSCTPLQPSPHHSALQQSDLLPAQRPCSSPSSPTTWEPLSACPLGHNFLVGRPPAHPAPAPRHCRGHCLPCLPF